MNILSNNLTLNSSLFNNFLNFNSNIIKNSKYLMNSINHKIHYPFSQNMPIFINSKDKNIDIPFNIWTMNKYSILDNEVILKHFRTGINTIYTIIEFQDLIENNTFLSISCKKNKKECVKRLNIITLVTDKDITVTLKDNSTVMFRRAFASTKSTIGISEFTILKGSSFSLEHNFINAIDEEDNLVKIYFYDILNFSSID